MKFTFIYWFCLITIFKSSIATEARLLCMPFHNNHSKIAKIYAQIESQNHADVRQQLVHSLFADCNYAHMQRPDGHRELMSKIQTHNYQSNFKLDRLNSYVAPATVRRLFGHDYERDEQFFASDFAGNQTEHVFHCVLNYQYPGFCQYAQQLPGFNDFILSMSEQLNAGSELQKRMTAYWGGKEAFAALQQIHNTKFQARTEREWQAKRQVVKEWLQANEFNQQGISVLESCHMADQFVYHGNMLQMAQLKQIARLFNEVGAFQQEIGHVSELQQLVGHAAGFGCLSNQANRNHNLTLSQACLEIGQNIVALGRGLKAGAVRNSTNLYHMLRYPLDTAESLVQLVKTICIGIGKVALTLSKHELGLEVGNEDLMHAAHQDVDHWLCGGRHLYELAKQTWQDKSKLERYELVGNYATDLLLLKGLSNAGKLVDLPKLAAYKPQAFTKLGEIGREINQITGLTCAKGIEAVEAGFNIIENCPQILKVKDSTVLAIKHCNKKVKAVNQYLDSKITKLISRELEITLAGLPAGKNMVLSEKQLAKTLPNVPKISRKALPEALSGVSKEFAVFFDESQNMITQKEHCKQICQSFLHDSSQFKLPSKCLNHIVEQISEVDTYLRNMTVSEFICDKLNHIPHEMRKQLMKIDYPHFVHPIPNVKCREGKWLIEKFKGFHWDYKNTLEAHGEVSYKIIEELSNGCRHVEIKVAGMLDGMRKTMFSSDRLLIDVVKDFREAANAADVFEIDQLTKTITIEGFAKNGTKISGFINKNGTVPTFYPYLKKN